MIFIAFKKGFLNWDYWLSDEGLTVIATWCRQGLTKKQIAEKMGINEITIWRKEKENVGLCNALKTGREVADTLVENALFQNAINGHFGAQVFWLKNRKPNDWKERADNLNYKINYGMIDNVINDYENKKSKDVEVDD